MNTDSRKDALTIAAQGVGFVFMGSGFAAARRPGMTQ
jgi:hypothetical protein